VENRLKAIFRCFASKKCANAWNV